MSDWTCFIFTKKKVYISNVADNTLENSKWSYANIEHKTNVTYIEKKMLTKWNRIKLNSKQKELWYDWWYGFMVTLGVFQKLFMVLRSLHSSVSIIECLFSSKINVRMYLQNTDVVFSNDHASHKHTSRHHTLPWPLCRYHGSRVW